MKGTLIKEADFYGLKIDDKIVGLSDDITNNFLNYPHKLSIKNCEAIANGYDLDELAEETYPIFNLGLNATTALHTLHQETFKLGFQKAIELIGDKKFSEDDMIKAFYEGWYCKSESKLNGKEQFIKSLQQTEWKVEVLTDKIPADLAPGGWDVFLKLDAEGCLILKRVE